MFASDGWIIASTGYAWQIALFLTLGESFTAFGGALALAALVGAVSGLVLGNVYRRGTRSPRGVAHLRKSRGVDPVARDERRHGGACGDRQCVGRACRVSLRADDHDGRLQPGEAVALSAALPCGDGGRLGHRRSERLRRGRDACRRSARRCRRPFCWRSRGPHSGSSCCTATIPASGPSQHPRSPSPPPKAFVIIRPLTACASGSAVLQPWRFSAIVRALRVRIPLLVWPCKTGSDRCRANCFCSPPPPSF